MQHTTKAATVTTTDLGEFTAIAAAYTLDRDGDVIIPGAFEKTIDRWRKSGKRIPLHWNHSGQAVDIIGSIDPMTLEEIPDVGLKAEGRLDLTDSATAKEAWRSMKDGRMSLSFGYMTVRARKNKDGVNELHELDLFEISIVPVPANPDTRILSLKSPEELREDADRLTREVAEVLVPDEVKDAPAEPVKTELQKCQEHFDQQLQDVKQEFTAALKAVTEQLDGLKKNADHSDKETLSRSVEPLRKRGEELALEVSSLGVPPRKPPTQETTGPELDYDELKRNGRNLMRDVLSTTYGVDT